MYEPESNTEKLAALVDTSTERKIKSSIFKLKINPDEVVLVKDDSLAPHKREAMAKAFAAFHRHRCVIFIPENATLETLPSEQVKDILSSVWNERLAHTWGGRIKRLFTRKS